MAGVQPSGLHLKLHNMDPSMFLQYSPPNGLPQESKLATYMNHSTSTPTRSLNQAMGQLSLESSPTAVKKVLISEFVPINYYTPSNIHVESPQTSPPITLIAVANSQVHQENVGGTTYFYSTNDSLNTSGALNSSASLVGSESCLGVNVGTASPYGSRMYSSTPPHIASVVPKPIGSESCRGVNVGPKSASPYGSQMYSSTPPHMGPIISKSEVNGDHSSQISSATYGAGMFSSPPPRVSSMVSNSVGSESCLGVNIGPNSASPFASQMYSVPPPHMGSMVPKPEVNWEHPPLLNSAQYGSQMYSSSPPYVSQMINKLIGSESCLGVHVGPNTASPYGSQMYSSTPPHMVPKPIGSESCMGVNIGQNAAASAYGSQMFSTPPPHIGPIVPKSGLASSFYMPEIIRSEIFQRNEELFLQADLHRYPELPQNLEMYSDLMPLEAIGPHSLASSYRASHRQSGEQVALRRLHAYASLPTKRMEMWKQIDHPNIVRLHECYTSQAFGDHSLILIYDFHPACVTLTSKYLSGTGTGNSSDTNGAFHDPFSSDPDAPRPYTHQKNAMLRAVACGALLPEAVLWSLLVQLTAALRAIHTAGLACRTLDPTKVIMNGSRVRIAWCGAADAMRPITNDLTQAQQEDLTALGRLALALACRTMHCDNLAASMDLVARTYSADLKNLILYLLSNSTTRRSVTDLMPMIGARFYTQVEALERRADVFEEQLAHEIHNGRLLRILIKLGVVNERPELSMDPSWSETGNRYMLKLFRDHLFHSVTEDGRPWIDQAHLAHCLNQLDSGTNTKVELMSRDEQSVLVVTYAELKHCLEQAFEEVMQMASRDA